MLAWAGEGLHFSYSKEAMSSKLVKSEAKNCLEILFRLLRISPYQENLDLAVLFQAKEVDIDKYLVLYPVPVEGYYWITPRQRDLRTFFLPAGKILFARFHKDKRTVDIDFEWKNKDVVVTMSDQDFNVASARMQKIGSKWDDKK